MQSCSECVCCCFQPFVDEVHPLQSLFLPRVYALLIPVVAGVIALIGLGNVLDFYLLLSIIIIIIIFVLLTWY